MRRGRLLWAVCLVACLATGGVVALAVAARPSDESLGGAVEVAVTPDAPGSGSTPTPSDAATQPRTDQADETAPSADHPATRPGGARTPDGAVTGDGADARPPGSTRSEHVVTPAEPDDDDDDDDDSDDDDSDDDDDEDDGEDSR